FGDGPEKERVDDIFRANAALVPAKIRGFYKIKPLAPNICRVTFVAQGMLGGHVPDFAMKWAIKYSLSIVKRLQNNRDKEVDGAERSGVEEAVKIELDKLDRLGEEGESEVKLDDDLVPRVVAKFDALKRVDHHVLEHSDFRVQLKKYAVNNDDGIVGKFASDAEDNSTTRTGTMMTMSSSIMLGPKKKRDDGELVVGSASAVVDASIERCAAWAFAEGARLRTKDGDGSHRIRCDERPEDSQSQLVDTAYKLPGGKLLTCT
ncbi:hypothetical protein TeGR_g3633, partial [Tetraparma gracilis]